MTRVLVLLGGNSSERPISLRSGAAVISALSKAGHRVTSYDLQQPLDTNLLATNDVVFPVLHGSGGEDGSIQSRLEALGIPFVGSGMAASQLCFDKWAYKQKLLTAHIPTPPGTLVTASTLEASPLTKAPFVLKPFNGGSSVDTFIVRDVSKADWPAMERACDAHGEMLLEALVSGTEITVGVLDDVALPVIEIIPPQSGEFDYENKYNGKTQELCPPEHVPADIQAAAQRLAESIHGLTGCRDFSRTDMIIDKQGSLWVLETNTIPGMTNQSLFPRAAHTAGIAMPALVDQLVAMALNRAKVPSV